MKMTPDPALAGYKEIPCPNFLGGETVKRVAYQKGDCSIIVAREIQGGPLRWHLSISCSNRLPTWEELRDARYALLPDDATMVMILPPKKDYVNLHDYCFHLHEIVE
jgi:hypothetical protein